MVGYDELEYVHDEFLDFIEVVKLGAKKYDMDNWLEPDGHRTSHKEMHDSMFHHLAESFAGKLKDDETGLDPLLHLITRAMMLYTRRVRGIRHPNDPKPVPKGMTYDEF